MGTVRAALAFKAPVRIALVVFGGMTALQSSASLDLTKLAYLAVVVVCLAGALTAVWTRRRTAQVRLAGPWIAASAALAALLAISFLVARSDGTPITDWVRDIAAYALFATVPVFALDPQARSSRTLIVAMLVLAGLLGGVSWAVEWLGRREILELPFDRFVFPSPQLPGMLYLFAVASALTTSRRRAFWVGLAGLTLALFLVTGTRSSLLLPISALAMGVVAGKARIGTSLRVFALHGIVAVALVLAFQLGVAFAADRGSEEPVGIPVDSPSSAPDVLGDRYGSLPATIGNPVSDASIKERLAQYEAAWRLFLSSPIVGVGPGHPIDWVDVSGYPRSAFTADTPLVMPAKFGLLGILVFISFGLAYAATVKTALRRDRRSPVTLTLAGFGFLAIVGIPLGFLIEDKGSSLAIMLLLALAFTARSPDTDDRAGTSVAGTSPRS